MRWLWTLLTSVAAACALTVAVPSESFAQAGSAAGSTKDVQVFATSNPGPAAGGLCATPIGGLSVQQPAVASVRATNLSSGACFTTTATTDLSGTPDASQPLTVEIDSTSNLATAITFAVTITNDTQDSTIGSETLSCDFSQSIRCIGSSMGVSPNTAIAVGDLVQFFITGSVSAFDFSIGNTGFALPFPAITSTTTSLSASGSPDVGQPITLTAQISSTAATGTVEFFDGAASLGPKVGVRAGQATLLTSFGLAGLHDLSASYSGDANFGPSTGSFVLGAVDPAAVYTLELGDANRACESIFGSWQPVSNTCLVQVQSSRLASGNHLHINSGVTLQTSLGLDSAGSIIDDGTIDLVHGTFTDEGNLTIDAGGIVDVQGLLTVESGASVDVSSGGDLEVPGALGVEGGSLVDDGGMVDVSPGGGLTVTEGEITVIDDGTLVDGGMVEESPQGHITVTEGEITVVDDGTLVDDGGTMDVGSEGKVVVGVGKITEIDGGDITVDGIVELDGGGYLITGIGKIECLSGCDINVNGGTMDVGSGSTLTNDGTITDRGTMDVGTGGTVNNNGTIMDGGTIQNDGTFNNNGVFVDDGTFVDGGGAFNNVKTLTIDNGGSFDNKSDGTIANTGSITIKSGGTLDNAGALTNLSSLVIENGGMLTNEPGATYTGNAPIRSDTTPPTIVCTPPDATTWYGGNVSVPCTASDSQSGLADPRDASFALSTNVAAGTETGSAATDRRLVCDQAGNCAAAGPYSFKIDRAAPTISCGSPDGLWHNANVTILCTASDGGSGLANAADASFGVSTSVAAGTATPNAATGTRTVCDSVGNCATAGPIGGIMIDRAPPTLNLPANLVTGDRVVTFTVTASDIDESGLAVSCSPASGTLFPFGTTTVTCSVTDHAANATSGTFTVTVDPTLTLQNVANALALADVTAHVDNLNNVGGNGYCSQLKVIAKELASITRTVSAVADGQAATAALEAAHGCSP